MSTVLYCYLNYTREITKLSIWTGLQAAVLANQNLKQKAYEIESAGKHAIVCKRGKYVTGKKRGKICNRC